MGTERIGAPETAGTGLAVDIVIANHNYEEYLGAALDSACAQTHPDVRVIVVDDGSTDGSRERLRSYRGMAEIVLKENGGQASALNVGMARCRGDAVIFLDADDVLRPGAAAAVAEAFGADPALARLQFPMVVIDAEGRPTGEAKPAAHLRPPTGDLRREELAFPYDLPWLPSSASAFRTARLRSIFPIPEEDYPRHNADWYVVHLSALLGRAGWLDEVLAEYRVHGRNAYELLEPRLATPHVRDTVIHADATSRALLRLAGELGIEHPERILSISDLGNRLLSLRLEPELHPLPDDRVVGLLADSVRAARRRFDRSLLVKAAMVGWCLAVAVSPRPLVRRLGELLLFPQARRESFNRFLGRLYGDEARHPS